MTEIREATTLTRVRVVQTDGESLTLQDAKDAAVGTLSSGGWYAVRATRVTDGEVVVELTPVDGEPYRDGIQAETEDV